MESSPSSCEIRFDCDPIRAAEWQLSLSEGFAHSLVLSDKTVGTLLLRRLPEYLFYHPVSEKVGRLCEMLSAVQGFWNVLQVWMQCTKTEWKVEICSYICNIVFKLTDIKLLPAKIWKHLNLSNYRHTSGRNPNKKNTSNLWAPTLLD